MILSDIDLRRAIHQGHLFIDPFDPESPALQPAGIDFTLSSVFRVFDYTRFTHIDPKIKVEKMTREVKIDDGDAYLLHPGDFVLGSTIEWVEISTLHCAWLEGKSSNGRLGIQVHSTAGFIDPGFRGNITLEISNIARMPVCLWPGMGIGQLTVGVLTSRAMRPYGHPELKSKYHMQDGPTESRGYENF